jgi:hypothetical protein
VDTCSGLYKIGELSGELTRDALATGVALKVGGLALKAGKIANSGLALAKRGEAAEKAVADAYRLVKNTEHIESLTGTANYRVPDFLNRIAGYIGEVKDVKSLSYTRQLKDYVAYAQKYSLRFDLYVRDGAKLAGTLKKARASGLINIIPF